MKIVLFLSLVSVGWAKGIPDDVGIMITNGTDAFPGQFPYMAAIQVNGTFRCGGALIDPSWVVTDFFYGGYLDSQVILGLHDFDDFENGGQPEVYDVIQVVQEPQSFLALLQLSRPVAPGNPYIQTIALAPQDGDDYVGANCYFPGWGAEIDFGPVGGVLQYAQANVVGEEDCRAIAYERELCTIDQYTATCYRDEGGPLACRKDGQTYLVGTLKRISVCGLPRDSQFFRMSYYSDWIRAVIG